MNTLPNKPARALSVETVLDNSAQSLSKAMYRTTRVFNAIGVTALAVMVILIMVDVVTRYIFHRGLPGAYELAEFLMAILIGFGLAYTAVHKGHITVDVLISKFSPRVRTVISSITYFLSLALFSLTTWQVILNADNIRTGGAASTILLIPIYPFAYLVAFGSFLFCLVLLYNLLEQLSQMIKGARWRVLAGSILLMALIIVLLTSPLFTRDILWEMSPFSAGLFGLGLLIVLIFSGMPVGIVMALVGFLGFVYISGIVPGFTSIGTSPYRTASSYGLTVIPLFVLMGEICFYSGLSQNLYRTFYKWLGHLPGGLAMATVGACAGFAAVSGSSVATVATLGTVALPEMKKYKYTPELATGCLAAGGSIGILIPPSTILVIYGILTEQSIGKLFLAGFIPGILEAVFYIIAIYIICKRNPMMGPRGESTTIIEKFASLGSSWGVLALFILVIGGIYLGIFSPTEAAGVGAFGAFLYALGKRQMTWKNLVASLIESGKTTAMVFLILIGADIFGYFLAVSRLPFEMGNYVAGLPVNRYVILIAIIFVYLFLGAIMSAMAMIIITVPIFFPVILALGFDPIWFGIIIVRMVEIGQITPPVGINVYVMQGIAKDIPMYTIFRGIVPFLIADFCEVALLVAVPQLSLFLPSLMK